MTNAQMQVIAERGNEAMDRAMIGVKRPGRSAQVPVPDSIYFPEKFIDGFDRSFGNAEPEHECEHFAVSD
jgi:hypothetical protein